MTGRLLAGLCLLLWLGGCALTPPKPVVTGNPDPVLQRQLAALQHWSMEGKLAIRTPDDSHSARIQWQQQGEGFDIHLSGPAGLKPTRIYGMPGGVVFEQGDRTERAGSAEALSEKLIGWPLPASELNFWLLGLPSSQLPVHTALYTDDGHLSELQQAGWVIHFSQYSQQGQLSLPGRIEAVRGNLAITLLAKQWTIQP